MVRSAFFAQLVLFLLSTCCSGSPYYRKYGYNGYYEDEEPQVNEQWSLAQEPEEDYYGDDAPLPLPDYEELANFLDFYENGNDFTAPSNYWNGYGQLPESKPESELEHLRDLTHPYDKMVYRPPIPLTSSNARSEMNSAIATPASLPTSTLSPPLKASSTPTPSPSVLQAQLHQVTKAPGQKEIPFLRPPTPKALKDASEAHISKISPEKKPSAYDKLRNFIALEDQMQKEAQKRRSDAPRRQMSKRSFVADENSLLTGQLSHLKKNMS